MEAEFADKQGKQKLALLAIIRYINEEKRVPATFNEIYRAHVDAFGGSRNLPDDFLLSRMLKDLCNAGYLKKSLKMEQGLRFVTYTITNGVEKLNEKEVRIVANTIRTLELVSMRRG